MFISDWFQNEFVGVQVRNLDQCGISVSVMGRSLTKDNRERLRNTVEWLKFDINTVGCRYGSL